ncbi:sodium-dependent lysophosphatidylcholine symporter 1-like isoform X2 [Salminus brasiliensis]|uniref:sodium-dependent lysophosphatidylcholine symporter 1-like isoform X2 n=1 Tax=Salminus brasiliensis TaxID=930266 RepID=UPI003B834432
MAHGCGGAQLREAPSASEQPDNPLKGTGIPLLRKLCYAVGGMPYQMTTNSRSVFLPVFLLDVVQMKPFHVSIILFLGWIWDAVTDPMVGYAVSKAGRTRAGKLIPWIVYSTPAGLISYIMLWYTPLGSMSAASSFCWYFLWNCLLDTFLSCYHVPYSSLNMFLGGNDRDRDSTTCYRMGMEMFATLLGATIQGQIVGVYHAKRAHACGQLNDSDVHAGNYSAALDHNFTSPLSDTLHNTRRAYLISALVIGALYFLCCLVLFLGVKEQLAPLSKLDRIQVPYLTGMKMIVKHTPYLWLVFGFLFVFVAFQIPQGNLVLFCTHAAAMGAYFQHLVLILLFAATLTIPLWQMLLVRLGKKTTIFIGLSIYIPALIILSHGKGSFPVFVLAGIVAGTSLSSVYLLPWSMLPDVVDDFKVKNPLCTDLEPMFYSCYVFCNKFGAGLSSGVSTLALHFAGYQAGACRQDPRVITTLQVLFAPVPIVLLLIGMVLFFFYPINEQRRQQIQTELKKAAAESVFEDFTQDLNAPH